jgi:hypothetical protein
MRRFTRAAPLLLVVVGLTACGGGGGGNPGSPTPTIPSVGGSYSGNATLALPEMQTSVTCPASTVVTQTGSTVNIAPIVLKGDCGGMSIPLGSTTIDSNGALDPQGSSGTYNEPSCGTYKYTGSGGFYGNELRISMSATSSTCINFNLTIVMSR